jgi:hypothetical protein
VGRLRLLALSSSATKTDPATVPDEYISTDCRTGNDEGCQERRAVKCACNCHEGQWPWVERRGQSSPRGDKPDPPPRLRWDD